MLCGALLYSCARPPKNDGSSDINAWNAWIHVQKEMHPEYLWTKTPLGSYILEDDKSGTVPVGSDEMYPFVNVEYTIRNYQGQVQSTTDIILGQRLGTFEECNFYGARFWHRGEGYIAAGLEELISGMNIGEKVKAVVPQWLNTVSRFSNEDEYRKNYTDGATYIYDLKVTEQVTDIDEYQINKDVNFLRAAYGADVEPKDSIAYGCYYHRLVEPSDTTTPENGKTVKIEYVARLLNGQVFDTTIKDTAKVHNIYSAGAAYEPAEINWKETYDELTMGSDESALITGFKLGVFRMRVGEKGVVVFNSSLGYGAEDLGAIVPGYSPMAFEIEMLSVE